MDNSVLASIIICTYNDATTLEECIMSARNQTYKNVEIIVINDGSTDNTAEIIDKHIREDHRIKVLNKDNTGLEDSRYSGIGIATGKYIIFLDSDDTMQPEAMERLVARAEQTNSDIVICPYIISIEGGADVVGYIQELKIIEPRECLKQLLCGEIAAGALSRMVKREIYDNVFDKLNVFLAEDYVAYVQAIWNSKVISTCDYPAIKYNYGINSGSYFKNFDDRRYNDWIIFKNYIKNFIRNLKDEDIEKYLAVFSAHQVLLMNKVGRLSAAKEELLEVMEGLNKHPELNEKIPKRVRKMIKLYNISETLWRAYAWTKIEK